MNVLAARDVVMWCVVRARLWSQTDRKGKARLHVIVETSTGERRDILA
jgi:hypothetical protein